MGAEPTGAFSPSGETPDELVGCWPSFVRNDCATLVSVEAKDAQGNTVDLPGVIRISSAIIDSNEETLVLSIEVEPCYSLTVPVAVSWGWWWPDTDNAVNTTTNCAEPIDAPEWTLLLLGRQFELEPHNSGMQASSSVGSIDFIWE